MGEQVVAGIWGYSSVGRAPALQAGGHEFESRYLHENMMRAAGFGRRSALEIYFQKHGSVPKGGHLKNVRDK